VVDSAVVGRDIVIVKEETLLYCTPVSYNRCGKLKGAYIS
jgi:hypothetical protein